MDPSLETTAEGVKLIRRQILKPLGVQMNLPQMR